MFTAKARILVYCIPFFYPSHLDKMNKSHYRKGTVIPTNSVWPISAEDQRKQRRQWIYIKFYYACPLVGLFTLAKGPC